MKMTKTQMFAQISTVIAMMENVENKQEMLDFLAHEVELLNSKSERAKSQPSKPSKSVEENNSLRELLLAYFAQQTELKTIKDICSEIPEFDGFSSQKVAQLISPLVKENKVDRQKVGKTTAYGLK